MPREADISKKRVIETSKLAIEKTNECIRVVTEVRESVTELIDKHEVLRAQTKKDVERLTERVSAASNWAEANERQLANTQKHLERQTESAIAFHRGDVNAALDAMKANLPPNGLFARLKWLVCGPSEPEGAFIADNWT